MAFQHRARAIDLSVADVGKTIKSTKKRVKFSFVFDGCVCKHETKPAPQASAGGRRHSGCGCSLNNSVVAVQGE